VNAWATRRAAFLSAFLLAVLVGVVFPGGECAEARRSHDHVLTVVEVDDLPREARETLALIKQGGPFPWDALQDCLTDLSWRPAPGYVVVLENCGGLAASAPETFATTLEVLRHTARWWAGEQVPFWVFVGGLADGPYNLPRLDWAE